MSDHIPFDIQVGIIKRLPVKSLIQFRSVSKAWKSLINSSDFIARYNSQQHHLFIRYANDSYEFEHKYVSIVDDDTFPEQKVSLTLPSLAKKIIYRHLIGSSHGLVCLYGNALFPRSRMAVIWNPSIRKAVGVGLPNGRHDFCFGVCNNDPKIVKITRIHSSSDMEIVEVFTLSTGVWRRACSNLPRKAITFENFEKATIDGFIYWVGRDKTSETSYYNLIIAFDMTSEEFEEVNLPHILAHPRDKYKLHISKLRESLVVLEHDEAYMAFDVWVMGSGVSKSFRKLYTIRKQYVYARVVSSVISVLGFRKSGDPIIEFDSLCDDFEDSLSEEQESSLAVYKPYSNKFDTLGIDGTMNSLRVYPYIETLLLLDQQDSFIYDEG